MQTVQIKVFSLSELSQKAKDKAYYSWLSNRIFHFDFRQMEKVLHSFGELFHLKPKDFDYEYDSVSSYPYCRFSENDWFQNDFYMWEMSGVRLYKWLMNNRKDAFTGNLSDESIMKPMLDFIRKPSKNTTMLSLVRECLQSWADTVHSEYEYATSFKEFESICEERETLFFEDGKLYKWGEF